MENPNPEHIENDNKNFPFQALLNLLEISYEEQQIAKTRLENGTALKYRNLGKKAYLRLCRLFHAKPFVPNVPPDPKKLRYLIKNYRTRANNLEKKLFDVCQKKPK